MTTSESKLFVPEDEFTCAGILAKIATYFLANPLFVQEFLDKPVPRVTSPTLLATIVSYSKKKMIEAIDSESKDSAKGAEPITFALMERTTGDAGPSDRVIGQVTIYDYLELCDEIGLNDRINSVIDYSCVKFELQLTAPAMLAKGHSCDIGTFRWLVVSNFKDEVYLEECFAGDVRKIEWSDVKRVLGRHPFATLGFIHDAVFEVFLAVKEKDAEDEDDDNVARTIVGIKDLITEINVALGQDSFEEVRSHLRVTIDKLKKFVIEVAGTCNVVIDDVILDRGLATLYHVATPTRVTNYH